MSAISDREWLKVLLDNDWSIEILSEGAGYTVYCVRTLGIPCFEEQRFTAPTIGKAVEAAFKGTRWERDDDAPMPCEEEWWKDNARCRRSKFGITTRRADEAVAMNVARQTMRGYTYRKRTNLGRRKGDAA